MKRCPDIPSCTDRRIPGSRANLCFVDTGLPLFGAASINGFSVFGRHGLAKQPRAPGGLQARRRR